MNETFQLFNLETMSGVFPGTRTVVFQRVRLAPVDAPPKKLTEAGQPSLQWARLLWYDDPPACVVELEQRATGVGDTPSLLVRIPMTVPAKLAQILPEALSACGWRLVGCGSCSHWQSLAVHNPDGLPTGRCRQQIEAQTQSPAILAAQSMLALPCVHWNGATPPPVAAIETTESTTDIAPIRKRAEQESDERWTLTGQVRRWLRRAPAAVVRPAPQSWEERVVERSGVGAGTEPCFACQGRIANLGALAVATPEGDKQTFSIWRCRTCFTYYLNDWIDRWERTDSLETEERYYRLSPSEALEVLAVIDNVVHAEHPAQRHERNAQRDWMLAFVGTRPVLSHQVRQGR